MKKKGFILASVVAGVLGFFMGRKIADKKIENLEHKKTQLEDQVNEEQDKISKLDKKMKNLKEKIKNIRA